MGSATTTTTLILLLGVTMVLCGPCPDMEDFNVMYSSDKFLCSNSWYGKGNNDPALGCNPYCESSGYDRGLRMPADHYNDAPSGTYTPMDSLYVWPGCTFYGYSQNGYTGSVTTFVGPIEIYNMPDGPSSPGDTSCANGFSSYKCLCIQEPIDCVPSDVYSSVLVCDNIDGIIELWCNYQQQVGTSYTSSAEESMSVSSSVESAIQVGLFDIFSTNVGQSETTGYDWGTWESTTYDRTDTALVTAEAPAGSVLHIDQVVGLCEDNVTRPNYFKSYHTDAKGNVEKGSVRYFTAEGIKGDKMVKPHYSADNKEARNYIAATVGEIREVNVKA